MNTDIGIKLSFYELLTEKNYKIEIPIIQRDYVQGRENVKDIRDNFLKVLKHHLCEDKPINLDFVYGSIENSKFIPLDGQQRLTTLFLLHWYLASRDSDQDELGKYAKDGVSKFTYETRISSREFCNALVKCRIKIRDGESVSDFLRDQAWYYLSWERDPTISAMLNTLDSIHGLYFETEGFYKKLIDCNDPLIFFQFIELKNFGLSDQLYIKMNSRGKGLTDFENLKAKLEQIVKSYDKHNSTNYSSWFSGKMDREWTEFFWPYRDANKNVFDDQIMNFLRSTIINTYALKENGNLNQLKKLINTKSFNFYLVEEVGCADFETIYESLRQLDILSIYNDEMRSLLDNDQLVSTEELFQDTISDTLSYPQRIQLYALYQYVVQYETIEGLFEWMRVIRNLTENTRIEDVDTYVNALNTVRDLLQHAERILTFLLEVKDLKSFAQVQVEEEKMKATLLLRQPEAWRNRIVLLENHAYFQGQIRFILDFSGIEEAYERDRTLNWDDQEKEDYIRRFDEYKGKILAVFEKNGIRKFDYNRFERALLSLGDYTLNKGRNWSFLVNGKDRDISWKRLLRDNNTQRVFLKQLLNKISATQVEESLGSIINRSDVMDWRRYFVNYGGLMGVCGRDKFIRWEGEKEILLLEKSQTNGLHREYYSFALYLRLKELGFDAIYVPAASIDERKYISKINGHSLSIDWDCQGVEGEEEDGVEYGYFVNLNEDESFFCGAG